MLIALCDDDARDAETLAKLMDVYQGERQMELRCMVFSTPEALGQTLAAGARFDGFLLDILMPGMNGIELAELIRRHDDRAFIVYTTSSGEFALEAYHVRAARYLSKPVKQAELFEALDRMAEAPEHRRKFDLRTAAGVARLEQSSILYVESRMHKVAVSVLGQGEPVCSVNYRCPFEEIVAPLLENPGFLRVHKSFLVNLDRVKWYDAGSFTMENDDVIPISQKFKKEVKQRYLAYFEADGRRSPFDR